MSYKDLKSYQQAAIVYDYTAEFCARYLDKRSRTYDQMIQAARSGKQNIVEGSAQRTSERGELKLTGVARASFAELLEDYEDFLRQRGLVLWTKDDPRALEIRKLAYKTNRSYRTYESYLGNPEAAANCAICLISQATYLLDRQIKALEEEFIKEGGYTENLRKARIRELKKTLGSFDI